MSALKILKHFLLLFVFIFLSAYSFYAIDFCMNSLGNFLHPNATASVSDSFQPEVAGNQTAEIPVILQRQELNINAESFISTRVDSSQQVVLIGKNQQKQLLIASLTKLMTAMVSLDNYDFSQNITISKEAVAQGGFFKAGEVFPVKTLLYAALIGSDNSAAYALSELMGKDKFFNLMNIKAKELGLLNTYYSNSVGFGLENHSTAEDLVKLTKQILEKYSLIFQITLIPEFNVYDLNGKFHHKVLTTNQLLTDPSLNWRSAIIGGKTGNNEEAGECLILVLKYPDSKNYLISVILNSKDRFGEMKNLIDWVNINSK